MSVPALPIPNQESFRSIFRGVCIDLSGLAINLSLVADFLSGAHSDSNLRLVFVALGATYLGVGLAGVTALMKK